MEKSKTKKKIAVRILAVAVSCLLLLTLSGLCFSGLIRFSKLSATLDGARIEDGIIKIHAETKNTGTSIFYRGSSTKIGAEVEISCVQNGVTHMLKAEGIPVTMDIVRVTIARDEIIVNTWNFEMRDAPEGLYDIRLSYWGATKVYKGAVKLEQGKISLI